MFNGFHIHHYKELASTNTEALSLIDKGIADEIVIIADKQTSGRGRSGKVWFSHEGNFHASLIINQLTDINKLTELTFVAAVAVGNALLDLLHNSPSSQCSSQSSYNSHLSSQDQVVGSMDSSVKHWNDTNIQYKWPNDVLIDGKKISGILLEKRSDANWLVIGIGINITHAPLSEATCISNYSEPILNIDLLKKLILNFNKLRKKWLCDGFCAIRKTWVKMAYKLNEQINIKLAGNFYEGVFTDIDKNGRLVLQRKDSNVMYFNAGELYLL